MHVHIHAGKVAIAAPRPVWVLPIVLTDYRRLDDGSVARIGAGSFTKERTTFVYPLFLDVVVVAFHFTVFLNVAFGGIGVAIACIFCFRTGSRRICRKSF